MSTTQARNQNLIVYAHGECNASATLAAMVVYFENRDYSERDDCKILGNEEPSLVSPTRAAYTVSMRADYRNTGLPALTVELTLPLCLYAAPGPCSPRLIFRSSPCPLARSLAPNRQSPAPYSSPPQAPSSPFAPRTPTASPCSAFFSKSERTPQPSTSGSPSKRSLAG